MCKGLEAGALHMLTHALGPLPLASAHAPDTHADRREHSGMHKRLPVRGAATQAQARSQTPSTRTSGHTRIHTHTHIHTHARTHSPDAAGHPQFAPTVPSGGKSWHGGWTSAGHSVEPWTLPGPPLPPSLCFLSPVPPQQPESLTKQG